MSDWNSKQYIKFKNQRTQPSLDLINRLNTLAPKRVLDIGCGPGNSTAALLNSFPNSEIIGIDSSHDMLNQAKKTYPSIKFEHCKVPDGLEDIDGRFDLIFSNACIHWIPDHRNLISKLLDKLADNGVIAVQIPLIQEAPFYKLLNNLISSPEWQKLSEVKIFHNLMPEEYYDLFSELQCDFDIWQTTYYHIMESQSSIIEWYKGSGLRPYLDALTSSEQDKLINTLSESLSDFYSVRVDSKIIMRMPRLFFIVKK